MYQNKIALSSHGNVTLVPYAWFRPKLFFTTLQLGISLHQNLLLFLLQLLVIEKERATRSICHEAPPVSIYNLTM